MNALHGLRAAAVEINVIEEEPVQRGDDVDAIVEVSAAGTSTRFAVETKRRAPYPNELHHSAPTKRRLEQLGHPLLVAPFISEPLAAQLTDAGWSWADAAGNFDLRAPGLLLRQRSTNRAPKVKRRSLPQGSGALGIIRALMRFGRHAEEEPSATGLAHQAGVSQPRASQVLGQLHDLGLVDRSGRGRWVPDREQLLDRFLEEYRGPGGSERFLYSLDPLLAVAQRACALGSENRRIAVSADVGPDLLVHWRRPSVLIVYTEHDLRASDLAAVDAQGRHDANVIVRSPADRSVFRDTELLVGDSDTGAPLRIADEVQLIWDLEDLGGRDRLEAAGKVREWLLNHP